MFYSIGMFLNFSLSTIIFEIYYYHIYKKKQLINKMKLMKIIIIKLLVLLLSFIIVDYSSTLIQFTLYIINIFSLLFLYNDTLKNKILNYLIVFTCTAVSELLISGLYIIILELFGLKINFPKDLALIKSLLFFVPIPFITLINFFIAHHITNILKFIYLSKKQPSFLLLMSCFILMINMSIIYSSKKNNFMYFSIIYFFLFLITLYLINKYIDNFINAHYKNLDNKYFLEIVDKQKKQLLNINNDFKKIRKRNHDFINHIIIINQLLENNDKKVTKYIKTIIKKYE